MKSAIFLILPFILFQGLATGSDKPDQQAELARLQEAITKTNIFELPSFTLKASVQVAVNEKFIEGSYQLLWNGPDHWREEISFPGYHEIQIGGKGVIWVQRSTDFIPLAIFNLHNALGFGSSAGIPPSNSLVRFGLTPKDIITKKRERKEFGERSTCLEIHHYLGYQSELCVRDDNGAIVRETSYEADKDFQPIGSKIFPRVLTFKREDQSLAKVTVTELIANPQFSPDSFSAPAGLSPQQGCMNPQVARLIKKQPPSYPDRARSMYVQGTVSIQTAIGIDGIPRIDKVVQSPSSDLEQSSVSTIKEWRYDPASCDGKPVETDTLVQVNYTLSH